MPQVLYNAFINTLRSAFNAGSGQTSPASAKLTDVVCHFEPIHTKRYTDLPPEALSSEFEVHVDSGTDIVFGDFITNVRLLDKVTPWFGISANDTLHVIFTEEGTQPILAKRHVYIQRVRAGGPAL